MPSRLDPALSAEDRVAFLRFARNSVERVVAGSRKLSIVPQEEIFSRVCGVFVTLHVHGKLRGCIGVVEGHEPLSASLAHCAEGAALHDPRFSPIRKEELSHLQIEISLLSVLTPIRPEEIEIGKHGLLIDDGRNRGLLLPQVAPEHHLDRESFLAETCRKAGLPRDAWKSESVQIFGFACEVFSDESASEAPA